MRLEEFNAHGSETFRRNSTSRNSLVYASRIAECEKNEAK
jgi:hypothetical protein